MIQLEAVGAGSKVRQAERHLVLCMAEEHEILARLYHFQTELAAKQLNVAEEGIGTLRHTIRQSGLQIAIWTPCSSVKLSSQSHAMMTNFKRKLSEACYCSCTMNMYCTTRCL